MCANRFQMPTTTLLPIEVLIWPNAQNGFSEFSLLVAS